MKKPIISILLLSALFLFSCEKKDTNSQNSKVPIQSPINRAINEGICFVITSFTIYVVSTGKLKSDRERRMDKYMKSKSIEDRALAMHDMLNAGDISEMDFIRLL